MQSDVVALIADIVGSRRLDDRSQAQAQILTAFQGATEHARPAVPAYATVGDEFQTVYDTISQAVIATTVVPLLLPQGIELRFGLGVGIDDVIESDGPSRIRDGSAWWHARDAIDRIRRAEKAGRSYSRTGIVGPSGGVDPTIQSLLLLRDHIFGRMRERDRTIALAGLRNIPQSRTAQEEGISQPAVSQSWNRSGAAALVEMVQTLKEATS